jgi:CRP-like cAMP-binding protein
MPLMLRPVFSILKLQDTRGDKRDLLRSFIRSSSPEMDDSLVEQLVEAVEPGEYPVGTLLVRQGDVATDCYFVLAGCLRMFSLDEEGNEKTVEFFTEQQSVVIYESYTDGRPSPYGLECSETCLLVAGDLRAERDMHKRFPVMQDIIRAALENRIAEGHERYSSFKVSSPEQRYLQLLERRPGLAGRVPQHQLASYLGITPESFSRIKRRLHKSR